MSRRFFAVLFLGIVIAAGLAGCKQQAGQEPGGAGAAKEHGGAGPTKEHAGK